MSKSDIPTKHLNLKLEKKDSKTIPKASLQSYLI